MTTPALPVRTAIVVGAGLVGLSTAWFLQEQGVEVTVLDHTGVAAGSSWGNAGWISPGLVLPLPEPSVLRYGLTSMLDPTSALYIPFTFDPKLWAFLTRFAMHCTAKQWRNAMSSYVAINHLAFSAYDDLAAGGVTAPTNEAPIMAAYEHDEQSKHLRHELELLAELGQPVLTNDLTGEEARALSPHLSDKVSLVMQLNGQRFFDPGAFANSLADAVRQRGGSIVTGVTIAELPEESLRATVVSDNGTAFHADAVVLATGAWLNTLANDVGVRMRVQAGRGYSFSVPTDEPVATPIYFPALRVACTPYRSGLRIGGTMEFRSADAPLDPRRVDALVKVATPMLRGVQWNVKSDAWVGPRPVTSDGMPLIGHSARPRTFIAGGHGMWGIALGPITGKLLAQEIMTGKRHDALRAFDPLRR
jgi:D-amino-acid dehydrogenase